MRIAYADPPYPGRGKRYPEKKDVNHRLLVAHLQEFDGWALSTGAKNLHEILPLCPAEVRVGAWVKPWGVGYQWEQWLSYNHWEPVIYYPARSGRVTSFAKAAKDWCSSLPTMRQEVLGQKPLEFCTCLFRILRAEPDDEFHDLFPGSGAVTRAWEAWKRQIPLGIV